MKKELSLLMMLLSICAAVIAQDTTKQKSTEKITTTFVKNGTITVAIDVVNLTENNLEKEITLNGKDVLISGNDNKITIKGLIGKITITGKDNDVVIESVNQIIISGNGNFVSWEKTSNGNQKPNIEDKGGYNNVGRKSGNALNKADD